MPVLLHLVSLQQAAGVEAHFTEFVRQARAIDAHTTHRWVDAVGYAHPIIAAQLDGLLAGRIDAKRRGAVRLPAWPHAIRRWHCRERFASSGGEFLVVWNRTSRVGFAVDAMGAERCIHWEHGAAWHSGRERERQRYLDRVPFAIANSGAAARVLELMWGYRGALRVCRNALRPSLVPAAPIPKRRPAGTISLGVAARLVAVKGVAIALHAVAQLRSEGMDVELHVAGEGPDLNGLRDLAQRLAISSRVTFHGAQADMKAFYRRIDCLLHTPLTEAFGLVAVEAAANGCPVLAAAVDGLPEAVADGITGQTIAPTLSVDDYVALGGGRAGLPERVYSPARDALVAVAAVNPQLLAQAVARLFADDEAFATMSASASRHVLCSPGFTDHVRQVLGVIDEFRTAARESP